MGIEYGISNVKMYIDGKEIKAESIEISIGPPKKTDKELLAELSESIKLNKEFQDKKKLKKHID